MGNYLSVLGVSYWSGNQVGVESNEIEQPDRSNEASQPEEKKIDHNENLTLNPPSIRDEPDAAAVAAKANDRDRAAPPPPRPLQPGEKRSKGQRKKARMQRRKFQMIENKVQMEREAKAKAFEEAIRDEMKGKQKMNKLKITSLTRSLEGVLVSPQFIHCPGDSCGFVFERAPVRAEDNEGVKGSDNQPLSPVASLHYRENRFRCRQCSTEFCGGCSSTPYHLGKTCEEHKEHEEGIKCRYCKTPIEFSKDSLKPEDIAESFAELPHSPDGEALAPSSSSLPDKPVVVTKHVCRSAACQEYTKRGCTLDLACGHACAGVQNGACFCLVESCVGQNASSSSDNSKKSSNQVEADFCPICWTEELSNAPCTRLDCGHVFHEKCLIEKLRARWPGARVTFAFAACPLCNTPMVIQGTGEVIQLLKGVRDLERQVLLHANQMLKIEKLDKDPGITTIGRRFYNNPGGFAMDLFSYYICHKCTQPYYGGKRQCENNNAEAVFDPKELLCAGCSGGAICKKHGTDFIFYKCRFCCSIASWFCFGSTHFCGKCHDNPYQYIDYNNVLKLTPPQCEGPDKCPLGIPHPPNGFEEFAIGCSSCKVEEACGTVEGLDRLNYNDEDD